MEQSVRDGRRSWVAPVVAISRFWHGFVYYPPSAGTRAYEKPLAIFEQYGFRPKIAQEATHWLTMLRLVGAGLGVTVAPACVRGIASAEVVCLEFNRVKVESMLEVAWRVGETRPIVERFASIARGGYEVASPALGRPRKSSVLLP